MFSRAFDRFRDRARYVYMIVLDENHVIQPHAVICASAKSDSQFVAGAQIRSGFASVENLGLRIVNFVYELACERRNPRHSSQEIQRRTLGAKNRTCRAFNLCEHLTRFYPFSFACTEPEIYTLIKQLESSSGN